MAINYRHLRRARPLRGISLLRASAQGLLHSVPVVAEQAPLALSNPAKRGYLPEGLYIWQLFNAKYIADTQIRLYQTIYFIIMANLSDTQYNFFPVLLILTFFSSQS